MLFLSLILTIGLVTTYTDLKIKKIYNQHLTIAALLGIIAVAYTAFFRHEQVLFHLVNGLIAFIVGFLLHRFALWRGGDAKLFTLYAFLMPPAVFNDLLFPNVVSLFACSFIPGMVILFPFFIKDIIINRKIIANDLFSRSKCIYLYRGVMRIIYYSWILFPFYYLARITNPFIILTIIYIILRCGNEITEEVEKGYFIDSVKRNLFPYLMGFVSGILMRLLLSPDSLSYPSLTKYLVMITISTSLSVCIYTTFDHFKDYHERVPFAPLLFMGCILSYTPFLTILTQIITRWNILIYR